MDLRRFGWLILSIASTACSGEARPPAIPVVIAPRKADLTGLVGPTKWVVSPRSLQNARPERVIDGLTIGFGHGVERYVRKGGSLVGIAMAPEPLVGVTKPAGLWLFIGRSGALYEATEPLGSLKLRHVGEPTRDVALGKQAIVRIHGDDVERSLDQGVTFSKVELPGGFGLPVALSLNSSGVGLLTMMPNGLMMTDDDGAHFSAVPLKEGVEPTLDHARLLVGSVSGGWSRLSDDRRTVESVDSPNDVVLAERELATHAGEPARLSGTRFVEIRADKLWLHELGSTAGKAVKNAKCEGLAFAGVWETAIEYACETSAGFVLERSEDLGVTWHKDGATIPSAARRSDRVLWVGPNGALVLKGACVDGSPGCKGVGLSRRATGDSWMAITSTSTTPSLYEVAFLPDGRLAAVGSADGEPTLFQSNDGHTFTETKLPRLSTSRSVSERRSGAIGVEGGEVRFVAYAFRGSYGAANINDGVISQVLLPKVIASIGAAGSRVLVLDGDHNAVESDDMGQHWVTASVFPGARSSSLSCSAMGCLVDGDQRIGWDLADSDYVKSHVTRDVIDSKKPKVSKHCKPTGEAKSLGSGGSVTTTAPTHTIDWGYATTTDPTSIARFGKAGAIESVTLRDKIPKDGKFSARFFAEGIATLQATLPKKGLTEYVVGVRRWTALSTEIERRFSHPSEHLELASMTDTLWLAGKTEAVAVTLGAKATKPTTFAYELPRFEALSAYRVGETHHFIGLRSGELFEGVGTKIGPFRHVETSIFPHHERLSFSLSNDPQPVGVLSMVVAGEVLKTLVRPLSSNRFSPLAAHPTEACREAKATDWFATLAVTGENFSLEDHGSTLVFQGAHRVLGMAGATATCVRMSVGARPDEADLLMINSNNTGWWLRTNSGTTATPVTCTDR